MDGWNEIIRCCFGNYKSHAKLLVTFPISYCGCLSATKSQASNTIRTSIDRGAFIALWLTARACHQPSQRTLHIHSNPKSADKLLINSTHNTCLHKSNNHLKAGSPFRVEQRQNKSSFQLTNCNGMHCVVSLETQNDDPLPGMKHTGLIGMLGASESHPWCHLNTAVSIMDAIWHDDQDEPFAD